MLFVLKVAFNGSGDKLAVDKNASVVDFLIEPIQLLFVLRDGEVPQLLTNFALGLNVADAVFLELCPFFRRVRRELARPTAVGLCRLAGNAEEAEQICALLEFFAGDVENFAYAVKGKRKGKHRRLYGRALPRKRPKLYAEPP